MAYSNTAAVLRADINGKVEEAAPNLSDFIGDKVMPEFSSPTKTGQYPVFKAGLSELLNDDVTTRARGGSYGKVIRAYTTDNFTCLDRGLEEAIDDTDEKDLSRFFNLEVSTAMRVMNQVRIGHERRVAAKIFDPAVFTATAASVAYTEANIATIAFPLDTLNLIDRVRGKGINGALYGVMSAPMWNRTRRSTLLQNYIRGTKSTDSTLNLSTKVVAEAFGLEDILVGRVPYNTAAKGKNFVSAFCWSNTYFWIGAVAGGELLDSGAGRSIVWNQEGGLFVTETYRNEDIRSNMVRVRQNTIEKVVNGQAGELITTSYS